MMLQLPLVVLVIGLLTFSFADTNNKPFFGRTQQRHVKLNSKAGLGVRGSSVNASDKSPSSEGQSKDFIRAATRPLFSMKQAATAVKDEVTDIFDSIVFAESGAERIENTLGVIKRHKLLIVSGTIAFGLRTVYGGKRGKDLGRDVMDDLRRKEVEKWGARAAKA